MVMGSVFKNDKNTGLNITKERVDEHSDIRIIIIKTQKWEIKSEV